MARQSWPVLALQVVLGAEEGTKEATGKAEPDKVVHKRGRALLWPFPFVLAWFLGRRTRG